MVACMLSTIDNPFDPFDQFDSWLNFDLVKGYNSCALLDRVAKTSDALSEAENDAEISLAIDDIVRFDPTGMFCKVERDLPEEPLMVEDPDDDILDELIQYNPTTTTE